MTHARKLRALAREQYRYDNSEDLTGDGYDLMDAAAHIDALAARLAEAERLLEDCWLTSKHPCTCICVTCEGIRSFRGVPTVSADAPLTAQERQNLDDTMASMEREPWTVGSAPAFNCKRCDGTGIYTECDPSSRLIARDCECSTVPVNGDSASGDE